MNQESLSLAYKQSKSNIVKPILFKNSNAEHCDFRIIKSPSAKDPYLHVQVVGKAVAIKMLPENIMRGDLLLRFSRADIAIIAHLGTKNELKEINRNPAIKFFKILKQILNKGRIFFMIEKEEGIVEEHAANEIYNNPSIVEKLTGIDGIKVGYSVAEEHYNKIIKLKEKF